MANNYPNDFNMNGGNMNRQTDLVLAVNEYAHVQNTSTGDIRTHVGPCVVTISQQETLVVLNSATKRFEKTSDYSVAKQLFTSAPEGWYVVLKNPIEDNQHPEGGGARPSPKGMKVGEKINIPGPVSFALYPGQMARVLRGHKLRSNQYLLARVYDADAANANAAAATALDAEGKSIEVNSNYFAGQLLVIKGTEISFYIPPTGIEVVARDDNPNEYVRDAVTLERLEYAILKDENGEKTYSHGPAVVFPSPTQTFVTAPKGGVIFRALELSPISGIYVKVIAAYDEQVDGKTVHHPIGEELFITGKDQMIYYPRPEHAMIQYDGKYMHHAIAIPEGEGRYILDRLTGNIKTVKGPAMYLPDPRKEVVVKRKLSAKECELYFPGNREVLEYNLGLSERQMEQRANRGQLKNITDAINDAYSTSNQESTLAIFEANSNIARGVSYTKPRTITLDTKYDGVVAINVWTGYAVNVVSKSGKREIVVGPATRLLDYDETLEMVTLSTGKPKTTDRLINTAYLRVDNNKVSDIVDVQTKDFVNVRVHLSYCVNFLAEHSAKWFSVDNYVKYLCDRQRSLLKREAKLYDIEEFYARATDIVRSVALNISDGSTESEASTPRGRFFKENGMLVTDVEVLNLEIERSVAALLNAHQDEMIRKTLELSDAEKRMKTTEQLVQYSKKEAELRHAGRMHEIELNQKADLEALNNRAEIAAKKRAEETAQAQAKADMQKLLDIVHAAELARDRKADDEKIATEKQLAAIEEAKEKAYAETVAKIMGSIAPGLIEAMNANANVELTKGIATAVSPYAMARDEAVADTVTKLLRGSPIEEAIKNIGAFKQGE
jgi:major vault protein